MSEDKKKSQQPAPNNVVALPSRCPVDSCGKKPHRMHFCSEHFVWFKEGLVTREGSKAKDFDKKYQDYLRRQSKAS